jgi:hypothetical protein
VWGSVFGGAKRDRTADLNTASVEKNPLKLITYRYSTVNKEKNALIKSIAYRGFTVPKKRIWYKKSYSSVFTVTEVWRYLLAIGLLLCPENSSITSTSTSTASSYPFSTVFTQIGYIAIK